MHRLYKDATDLNSALMISTGSDVTSAVSPAHLLCDALWHQELSVMSRLEILIAEKEQEDTTGKTVNQD